MSFRQEFSRSRYLGAWFVRRRNKYLFFPAPPEEKNEEALKGSYHDGYDCVAGKLSVCAVVNSPNETSDDGNRKEGSVLNSVSDTRARHTGVRWRLDSLPDASHVRCLLGMVWPGRHGGVYRDPHHHRDVEAVHNVSA